jgi:hypothetical protein
MRSTDDKRLARWQVAKLSRRAFAQLELDLPEPAAAVLAELERARALRLRPAGIASSSLRAGARSLRSWLSSPNSRERGEPRILRRHRPDFTRSSCKHALFRGVDAD